MGLNATTCPLVLGKITWASLMNSTHTRLDLAHGLAKVAYFSNSTPRRLIVFLHGFNGGIDSWRDFQEIEEDDSWWTSSDLVFFEYDSLKLGVQGVADSFRRHIRDFFPFPSKEGTILDGFQVRDDVSTAYEELILVGHSLGGLVLRRALADELQASLDATSTDASASAILRAKLRLFSPASEGFRPSAALGMIKASALWPVARMFLARSPSYADLQPESPIIVNTRKRTEKFVLVDRTPGSDSLRANILWASPDEIVITERYDSDYTQESAAGQNHSSVCKPTAHYEAPRKFVKTGSAW
jgi:pimeloyl-ACP methyl ester carboxylesterase